MMGWDSADFLQQAVNTCTSLSGLIQDCDLFNIQSDYTAGECTFEVPEILANDNPEGPRDGLPIGIPMQSGPEPATKYPVMTYGQTGGYSSAAPTSTSAKQTSSAVVPTLTYSPVASSTASGIYSQVLKASQASATSSAVVSFTSSSSSTVSTVTTSAASLTTGVVLSTSYITSATEVLEVVIEQVVVTVTANVDAAASSTAAAKVRRHLEEHSARRQSARERRMARR